MKLPISIARKLLSLHEGEALPLSMLKHPTISTMIDNGILEKNVQGRSKTRISITNRKALAHYLKNHFGIDHLGDYIIAYQKNDLSRTEAIEVASNSKLKAGRTFEGFLINCYEPVECMLDNDIITISSKYGLFTFVHNYMNFIPPSDVTIVGIENPDNFREIERQKYLFGNIKPLFVSRYPQNQNKDMLKWLQIIPNSYLHFGDFDFAGLNIYWNEYKIHLRERAQYFVPENTEQLISSKGNRDLYYNQQVHFEEDKIDEIGIITLLKHIRKHKKGLEQEIFIR
jgi:hypothetical protein